MTAGTSGLRNGFAALVFVLIGPALLNANAALGEEIWAPHTKVKYFVHGLPDLLNYVEEQAAYAKKIEVWDENALKEVVWGNKTVLVGVVGALTANWFYEVRGAVGKGAPLPVFLIACTTFGVVTGVYECIKLASRSNYHLVFVDPKGLRTHLRIEELNAEEASSVLGKLNDLRKNGHKIVFVTSRAKSSIKNDDDTDDLDN